MSAERISQSPEQALSAALADRIAHWNEFFATRSAAEAHEMGEVALGELDGLLGRQMELGEQCIFSGEATWATMDFITDEAQMPTDEDCTDEGYEIETLCRMKVHREHVQGQQGFNYGFAIYRWIGKPCPRIYYQFEVQDWEAIMHPSINLQGKHFMFVDAASATVISRRFIEQSLLDAETEVSPPDPAASISALNLCSESLKNLMQSTRFRRLSHHEQISAVDKIIGNAEQEARELREVPALLTADFGYVPLPAEGEVGHKPVPLRSSIISGLLWGVTMVGREELQRKAIRNDGDIWSKQDGLSLLVEIDEASDLPHPLLEAGKVIKVPLSGQEVELVMGSSPRGRTSNSVFNYETDA